MANISVYRVIYINAEGEQVMMKVAATTPANAWTQVQASDTTATTNVQCDMEGTYPQGS
jgi:hypothetical protein